MPKPKIIKGWFRSGPKEPYQNTNILSIEFFRTKGWNEEPIIIFVGDWEETQQSLMRRIKKL